MLDPFGPAPKPLAALVQPISTKLNLTTLPLHIHEVLFFAFFYHVILTVVSPRLSNRFFPTHYQAFNKRTKLSWDVHVVSLVQSSLVNTAALYVVFFDEERGSMDSKQRVWGYSGALGLLQAMALGYFLWDLWLCTWHFTIFGPGLLAHAVSAVTVFSFGFVSLWCGST